jgi:hypothetical protein
VGGVFQMNSDFLASIIEALLVSVAGVFLTLAGFGIIGRKQPLDILDEYRFRRSKHACRVGGLILIGAGIIVAISRFAFPPSMSSDKREMKEFVSADGGFKVLMPGIPTEKANLAGGVVTKNYIFAEKSGAFAVSYTNGSADEPDVEAALDLVREAILSSRNAKLTKEKRIQFDSRFPGRYVEADLIGPEEGVLRIQMLIANRNLYQLAVMGLPSLVYSEDANKFMDSFAFTK